MSTSSFTVSPLSGLAAPSPEQLAQSQQLLNLIAEEIRTDGPMRFDRYVELCLYAPGLGYYSGPSAKFGAEGDFVTAPMQSTLFGSSVGKQCAQWLQQLGVQAVMEFGAGDGLLAAQILNELSRLGLAVQYSIVELSADLQARQEKTISALAPASLANVRWLKALPAQFDGVILGNELIDAMPVRLFRLAPDGGTRQVLERYVVLQDDKLAWIDLPADAVLQTQVTADFDKLAPAPWMAGYSSEYAEQAPAWITSVAQMLGRGVLLLLDYGFGAQEYFHPQRSEGTLRCHYRHHAHDDVFYLPGLQDITAHVNFSALYEAGVAAGLELAGYTTQSHFLLNLGILQQLQMMVNEPGYYRQSQAVGRLVSEAEMGELFKVIAFVKLPSVGQQSQAFASEGFRTGDRSHQL